MLGEMTTNTRMEDKVEGCGGMRVKLSGEGGCWRLERVEEEETVEKGVELSRKEHL